jgi:hypothetical protein
VRRHELEHAIRAATTIIRQDQVFIIGSQSILGSFHEDELPEAATMSDEVDICPVHDDDKESLATELDAAIGEFSRFHETYGFYVQGVGQRTAVLPAGWTDRLVSISNQNTHNATGLCLEVHDLCAAKLMANRDKDRIFVSSLIDAGLVQPKTIADRLGMVNLDRFEGEELDHYVHNLVSSLEWVRK